MRDHILEYIRSVYVPIVRINEWTKAIHIIFIPIYGCGRVLKKVLNMGKYALMSYRLKSIGKNVKLDDDITVCGHSNIQIGDNVFIGESSILDAGRGGTINIGEGCEFAAHTRIISWNHTLQYGERLRHQKENTKPVVIENDVWVGFGVVITPGVHVGRYSIIAAGAVVVSDVPEGSVVGGVPASVVGTVKDYE